MPVDEKQWQFWVDRGGTFTDVVARRPDGRLLCHKLLSENPERYKDAAVSGIRQLLGLEAGAKIPANTIAAVKMGTTVATNALLERKGEPTVLLITKGFGDLLRIGYQNRPRLFDLEIILPELLYTQVIEVEERIDHRGDLVVPLNQRQVRQALSQAYDKGLRSAAVALMHGYRFPDHEQQVGVIASQLGFNQVSLSHKVSPLIKLVARGDTTVVDAYLSPILKRYVSRVSDALGAGAGGCKSLMFMQSNGGLTDAALFQGKDAILSGPAGGVIGMVRTAERAGFNKLIGFDMGGTSTDVCHYAGEFERSYETEVAGVRMRAPMMSIHTVAAGGGSILSFRQGRMQVGPESAGANPGPACYRRGGPLTVTDCNVILGKVQPTQFPAVFGRGGDQPLDTEAPRKKFKQLAEQIAAATGREKMPVEELAVGFLRIAVENMANAIKKISIQRGYDVTAYTLNCFGGAGGQHACQVADVLGMQSIYIHPFAGVLSALGMGLADVRAIREHQFAAPLPQTSKARAVLDRMGIEVRDEVIQQGIAENLIALHETAYIRTLGSHQTLPVRFGAAAKMRASFDAAHRQRFGFALTDQQLVIDFLAVEAIGKTVDATVDSTADSTAGYIGPSEEGGSSLRRTAVDQPTEKAQVYTEGAWRAVPLLKRGALRAGDKVSGPAIVVEATGTNVIEAGWQGKVLPCGALCLHRIVALDRQEAIGTDVDPIMLEVFNNLFMSIAEQMGATLANTAFSANIKERLDFSCAIFDAKGGLVANAPHVPVHLGSMSDSVRTILHENAGRIRPGDVFMMNNPYNGGTHLPDVTVITPIFDLAGEKINFVTASRGHHADIGGMTPGSAPPRSRHIDEEGVLINNFLLVAAGKLREAETRALLASGRYPCRNIDENMADLAAQIAANATGASELKRITRQFGLPVVQAFMGHVQKNAEECVRQVLDVLKDCAFTYPLDSGARIKVAISVDRATRSARVDFTGTSAQDKYNYNAPISICKAVVLYVFRTLVGADIPMNEGCLIPIEIRTPKESSGSGGSMINPEYPAAVISGNTEVSQAIADTLYGALGVIAGSQGTMNNFAYGNERFQNYETIGGGTGAGKGFCGVSATHSHMTNTRMTDPEVLETRFPVRLEQFSIRLFSGGKGKWQGGNGITRRVRFLEEMTATVLSSHRIVAPHGAAGGAAGKVGENHVIRADGSYVKLQGNDEILLSPGDIFVINTPGGGGYGGAAVEDKVAGDKVAGDRAAEDRANSDGTAGAATMVEDWYK